jgi:hypothetical protein
MEITKTFVNSFGSVLLAKIRNFMRRSIFLYALATALITFGLHFSSIDSISSIEFIRIWGTYFLGIVFITLIFILISAIIQSRRIFPRKLTFREEELILSQGGTTEIKSWDWIISAEEKPRFFAFLVQKRPRLEMFLSKDKLEYQEGQLLREWLIKHEKLSMN